MSAKAVAAGAGVISYNSSGAPSTLTAKWQRWVGGDAPVGDRVEATYATLPDRTCVKKDPITESKTDSTNAATNLAFFQRACMSWGDASAAPLSFDLKKDGDGLDKAVLKGPLAGEEVS